MSIHHERLKAVIYLYQFLLKEEIVHIFNPEDTEDLALSFKAAIDYALKEKEGLIELINDSLIDWDFARLGFMEQAILLLACGEAVILQTPKQVIIDEAIGFAKTYGDQEDTYKLINACLDKVLDI